MAGFDIEQLDVSALATADEFHIGGRQATTDLLGQLTLAANQHLLDIGSGPGGASRFVAAAYGCRVTGIDLTPEYVTLATDLARRTGVADRVAYHVADALDLPFDPGTFDAAYMLHVGMNIADKDRLSAEVARVLAPGGSFALYDVMRVGPGDVRFPVPWAASPAISHLESPEHYRDGLARAGLTIEAFRERREFALDFFRALREKAAAAGGVVPPLGLHLVMGIDFREKVANMIDALEREVIAPIEIIARKAD